MREALSTVASTTNPFAVRKSSDTLRLRGRPPAMGRDPFARGRRVTRPVRRTSKSSATQKEMEAYLRDQVKPADKTVLQLFGEIGYGGRRERSAREFVFPTALLPPPSRRDGGSHSPHLPTSVRGRRARPTRARAPR